jgi:acyltransferase 3
MELEKLLTQKIKVNRSYRIDALKGIAIIAVVLYHFGGGYLTYGYLGVDIFFVVSGYFMMKSITKAMEKNKFSYWRFIVSRVARLWPLILIMSTLALGLGLFTMLPDDLENLSESVIASNVFANNVLSCITTKNYWDIANVFKPLMHTWYVGVLMQAYVLLPLIYLIVFKFAKRNMNAVKISVVVITLISLIAYLLPVATTAEKFYYLPFRAFEITIGSLIAFLPKSKKMTMKMQYITEAVCFGIILFFLCANITYPLASIKLLIVVCATTILVYIFVNTEEKPVKFVKGISYVGRASFSIYLCHQMIVAYMYYTVTNRTDLYALMIFIMVVALLSTVIYCLVEKPLEFAVKKNVMYVLVPSIAVCLFTSAFLELFIYMRVSFEMFQN